MVNIYKSAFLFFETVEKDDNLQIHLTDTLNKISIWKFNSTYQFMSLIL